MVNSFGPEIQEMCSTIRRIGSNNMVKIAGKLELPIADRCEILCGKDTDAFMGIWNSMNKQEQDTLWITISDIHQASQHKKNSGIMLHALGEFGIKCDESVNSLSAVKLSAHCFLTFNDNQWQHLLLRIQAFNKPSGEWRSYDLHPTDTPDGNIMKQKEQDIRKAISAEISKNEYRGYNCISEYYVNESTEVILMKLTDRPNSNETWDEKQNDFQTLDKMTPFTITCRYNHDLNRISVNYPDNVSRSKDLTKLIADTLFGENGYTSLKDVKYDLEKFRGKSDLGSDISHNIKAAKVIGMTVWLNGNKRKRRSFYEEEGSLPEIMTEELGDKFNENTTIRQVQLKISYVSATGKPLQRNVPISETGICNFHSVAAYLQNGLRAFMRKLEVEQ